MSELYKDNLYEIRNYLDNLSFYNSLLVCKSWSIYFYKEKKRRISKMVESNILTHGFRHKMLTITKFITPYNKPYYGLCIYKGIKCAFHIPSSFKDCMPIVDDWQEEFWGPFEKLLPPDYSFSFNYDSLGVPEELVYFEHYLTARINDTQYNNQRPLIIDYCIYKHKYSNKFHVNEGRMCEILVYDTPQSIVDKLEESIDYKLIHDLKIIDVVHFEECHIDKTYGLNSVFTYLN